MCKFVLKCTSLLVIVLLLCSCSNIKNGSFNNHSNRTKCITIYGDYKCAYCKKIENTIVPKLKKDYIKKDKAEVNFVNLGFLGKDSMKAGRAALAVKLISDKEYLKFNHLIFNEQPKNSHKTWITNRLLDKQIDKLNLNDEEIKKVKKMYKKKIVKHGKWLMMIKKLLKRKKLRKFL
ncbi:DsbA family protein [Staphylococcus capitis]|uniref:DsbA family protein n=1 Tax=Staphylococcus capitis TaxID=29388 RepID=UPI000A7AB6C2|nr:thioredoxin domain-containing protein [Staphylococcus capitis]